MYPFYNILILPFDVTKSKLPTPESVSSGKKRVKKQVTCYVFSLIWLAQIFVFYLDGETPVLLLRIRYQFVLHSTDKGGTQVARWRRRSRGRRERDSGGIWDILEVLIEVLVYVPRLIFGLLRLIFKLFD